MKKDDGNMTVKELVAWAKEEATLTSNGKEKFCNDDITMTRVVDKGKGNVNKGKGNVDKGKKNVDRGEPTIEDHYAMIRSYGKAILDSDDDSTVKLDRPKKNMDEYVRVASVGIGTSGINNNTDESARPVRDATVEAGGNLRNESVREESVGVETSARINHRNEPVRFITLDPSGSDCIME
nr:hypothetical protein [Tanacetum cinerariifolium]